MINMLLDMLEMLEIVCFGSIEKSKPLDPSLGWHMAKFGLLANCCLLVLDMFNTYVASMTQAGLHSTYYDVHSEALHCMGIAELVGPRQLITFARFTKS